MSTDKPEQRPESAAADRIASAARSLIDAGNRAAQARWAHEQALANPGGVQDMFGIAQARRQAEHQAAAEMEHYIEVVIKNATKG